MNDVGDVRARELASFVAIALRVLNMRVLIILALVLDGVMFGWAMWAGGYDRLAIAGAFAVASWCLVHLRRDSA
jgi:hypothetical protein